MLSDELRYKMLKALESNPTISQRELAKDLGISLGKVNFCVQALIKVGALKVRNFKSSANKRGYMYALTPKGIEEKAAVTGIFLRRKLDEYDSLQQEIEVLRREVDNAP